MRGELDTEIDLLVCLATRALSSERLCRASDLIELGVDWDRLRLLAKRHGLIPRVFIHLRHSFRSALPPDSYKLWAIDNFANFAHSQYLCRQAIELSETFARHKVKVLNIKGPALAHLLYGEAGMRQFADLDLLIDEDQLESAIEILCGFRLIPTLLRQHEATRHIFLDNTDTFFRRSDSLSIDLHWQPTPDCFPFTPDFHTLFQRSATLAMESRETLPTVSNEDHCLLLCAHGARHGWTSLGDVCDIAELLSGSHELNLALITSEARRLNAERILKLAVALAAQLSPDTLRSDILALTEPNMGAFATRVLGRLLRRDGHGYEQSHLSWTTLRVIANPKQRLAFITSRIFVPTVADAAFCRLPARLCWTYYLVRPVRAAIVAIQMCRQWFRRRRIPAPQAHHHLKPPAYTTSPAQ
jgi:hypothetical protein